MMANAEPSFVRNAEQMTVPLAFTSLPVDLLCSVTEQLDVQSLARFAAACSACLAVAHKELRDAWLNVVQRSCHGKRYLHLLQSRATSAWETETFKGCSRNLKSLLLGDLTAVTLPEADHTRYPSSSARGRYPHPLHQRHVGQPRRRKGTRRRHCLRSFIAFHPKVETWASARAQTSIFTRADQAARKRSCCTCRQLSQARPHCASDSATAAT